jgi:hypothetical protein
MTTMRTLPIYQLKYKHFTRKIKWKKPINLKMILNSLNLLSQARTDQTQLGDSESILMDKTQRQIFKIRI